VNIHTINLKISEENSPGVNPASCKMGTGSFPGVKCGRAWRWPPTPI